MGVFAVANGQSLFNNATPAGLVGEGLRTRPRPGGGDYSEVQSGNIGAGASFRQWTFRMGDDFTIPPGGWLITNITVFGYQIDATQATVSSGNLEVRAGSVVGPIVAEGIVLGSVMTDIYRIFNANPTDAYRVQKIIYRVNQKLRAGYYWITYSANGNQSLSGPWCPFLTKAGALTTPGANAMQRQTGWVFHWVPQVDPGSLVPLDLPFWIDGYRLQQTGPGVPQSPPSELSAFHYNLERIFGGAR